MHAHGQCSRKLIAAGIAHGDVIDIQITKAELNHSILGEIQAATSNRLVVMIRNGGKLNVQRTCREIKRFRSTRSVS